MDKTQIRLSSGKKVNSAIDNASNYYQSRALTNRASDLDALLDTMGQGIQTVQAANEGIESGLAFLEQAKAVAEQALSQGGASGGAGEEDIEGTVSRPIEDFIEEGYTAVPAGADASDIEALIAGGATKLVLSEDVTLSESLNIGTSDVVIEGNGHKLVYNSASGGSAIVVDGADSIAEISNLIIEASGSDVKGIQVLNGGSVIIDNPSNIKVSGTGSQMFQNGNDDAVNLYAGEANTKAIVNQLEEHGLAATAANQFYVGSTSGDFGQGTWYLPSIGELMDMYGTDTSAMTSGNGKSGAASYDTSNMKVINDALSTLAAKDSSVAEEMAGYYWSSSEFSREISWRFSPADGYRNINLKANTNCYVRAFQLLENCFNPLTLSGGGGSEAAPQIGDVMYSNKTWGKASDYDGSKTAVGVICDVGEDGSVKIVNLKDLKFSSKSSTGNFYADNPYSGSTENTQWATSAKSGEDITGITNYDTSALLTAMKSRGSIVVGGGAAAAAYADVAGSEIAGDEISADNFEDQFLKILSNYDDMIKDASYQGINLLNNGNLTITLNESRSHKFTVDGVDARYESIGINTLEWKTTSDVEQSLQEIQDAINKMRDYSSMFGNSYQVIQTRQNFTSAIIDVLETGSDNLVLADMNEESANYLAQQTRQQLAVNSLSLASQSAQSVLSLF